MVEMTVDSGGLGGEGNCDEPVKASIGLDVEWSCNAG